MVHQIWKKITVINYTFNQSEMRNITIVVIIESAVHKFQVYYSQATKSGIEMQKREPQN